MIPPVEGELLSFFMAHLVEKEQRVSLRTTFYTGQSLDQTSDRHQHSYSRAPLIY